MQRINLKSGLICSAVCMVAYAYPVSAARFSAPSCNNASVGRLRAEPPTDDMVGPADGVPHGAVTPQGHTIGWAIRPRVWRGNTPQPGWTIVAPTAMIYAAANAPLPHGVRVQVRNIELFVKLASTGNWCMLDHRDTPGGGLYLESFAGDNSIPMHARAEPTGGISVRLVEGRNFHFWGDKVTIPAGGMLGIYVQYEARLRPDGDVRPGDLARATYLGAASADYWISPTALSGYVGTNNEDVAISRFKKLTIQWRFFTMNSNGGLPMAPSQR